MNDLPKTLLKAVRFFTLARCNEYMRELKWPLAVISSQTFPSENQKLCEVSDFARLFVFLRCISADTNNDQTSVV